MTWTITGTNITDAIGIASPTAGDAAWATKCADQVNSAITTRLNGYTVATSSDAEKELTRTALLDGIAAYKDRDAPHGILSIGPDGEVARVGSDIVRWSAPVIARYAVPGIA